MRPILFSLPSKWVFFAAIAAALGLFARDLLRRARAPAKAAPLSANPLLLLAGALALLRFRAPTESFIPEGATFAMPWQPIEVHAYGVMLGLSMLLGWFIAMRFAREDGIASDDAGMIYMWTAVWAIIGARILYVVLKWNDEFARDPLEIFRAYNGGLVAYGGMIGGFLASWYGCHKRGIPLLQWADVSAPSVVLGTGITRVGCLLNGCDYGRRSGLPWAVSFPKDSAAWQLHHRVYELPASALRSFPVHPTQIYESIVGLSLFAALIWIRRHRRYSGQVFLAWVIGYGFMRPLIEMLRDDVEERGALPILAGWLPAWVSPSEVIGWTSVALGLALWVALSRRHRGAPESLRYWSHPAAAGAGAGSGSFGLAAASTPGSSVPSPSFTAGRKRPPSRSMRKHRRAGAGHRG